MNTLKEQRMIHAHQWGRRDYREDRPMVVPVFLKDQDERDSYVAGYRGEERRATKGGL